MIAHLTGKLVKKGSTRVVLENHGVGFHVDIPVSSFQALGEEGEAVTLLTHLHVREDALQLYGFVTAQERDLFELLISVTGIGPRMALGILSGMKAGEFREAVLRRDVTALTRAPGVGRKKAERLILELKEKIGDLQPDDAAPALSGNAQEAVLGLVSLGYKPAMAQKAVDKLLKDDVSLSVEALIRQALRML